MTVASQESVLDCLADLIGLGLPGTKTDGRNLGAGVEGVSLPVGAVSQVPDTRAE